LLYFEEMMNYMNSTVTDWTSKWQQHFGRVLSLVLKILVSQSLLAEIKGEFIQPWPKTFFGAYDIYHHQQETHTVRWTSGLIW